MADLAIAVTEADLPAWTIAALGAGAAPAVRLRGEERVGQGQYCEGRQTNSDSPNHAILHVPLLGVGRKPALESSAPGHLPVGCECYLSSDNFAPRAKPLTWLQQSPQTPRTP